MLIAAVTLISISLDAGPVNKVLDKLIERLNGTNVEVHYVPDDTQRYQSPGVRCMGCTLEMVMEAILKGTPLTWNNEDDDADFTRVYSVCACQKHPPQECRPEAGGKAPLPPCSPKALAIGVTEL